VSETERAASIRVAVEQFGGFPIRVQSGRLQGGRIHCAPAGTPDWLVLLPHGRSVWLEVKDPESDKKNRTSKTADDQAAWKARAARIGHLVFKVTTPSEAIAACQEAMR
jgi:hypothetical protein